jgi:hypothetical protein
MENSLEVLLWVKRRSVSELENFVRDSLTPLEIREQALYELAWHRSPEQLRALCEQWFRELSIEQLEELLGASARPTAVHAAFETERRIQAELQNVPENLSVLGPRAREVILARAVAKQFDHAPQAWNHIEEVRVRSSLRSLSVDQLTERLRSDAKEALEAADEIIWRIALARAASACRNLWKLPDIANAGKLLDLEARAVEISPLEPLPGPAGYPDVPPPDAYPGLDGAMIPIAELDRAIRAAARGGELWA